MKSFMDKDFMLYNDTAKHLFHDYAENLPIVDYHCHISPKEIYEDRRYNKTTSRKSGSAAETRTAHISEIITNGD